MQVTSVQEIIREQSNDLISTTSKRLTPMDYANAGILKAYDRSAEEREAHDKYMEKYRLYLMRLCKESNDSMPSKCEDE
jgi:hypothetical protein